MELVVSLVKVTYDHRVDGEELIAHEKVVQSHKELCAIIDAYPWASEMELFEKYGVGGGFHFLLGDDKIYACYQFVPVNIDAGVLDFDLVLEPGFLKLFGRKAVSKHFDIVSIAEAKAKIKELFDYSIASLYQKHKR